MGNVCSSGRKKKNDDDNASEKSEESPSYQLAEKVEKNEIDIKRETAGEKEAPLADPELISDLSTGQNTSLTTNSPTDGNISKILQIKAQTGVGGGGYITSLSDSVASSPRTTNPPCDIIPNSLPSNLALLQGKPISSRRTENDRKIIVYVLTPDGKHRRERMLLQNIYTDIQERCASHGFEILISDCHSFDNNNEAGGDGGPQIIDAQKWAQSPLEAQGGHNEAANCLAEISRHSNFSYIIPLLFLGTSLGTPLLPLTIENHDFTTALSSAESSVKSLLEKWYLLDNSSQPPCYRLNTKNALNNADKCNEDLMNLLTTLIEIFSKELRDTYLTTVVEQEINNTILINQELAKRCIWLQTGNAPAKSPENPSSLDNEMNRRLIHIHADLKNQLLEKNFIRISPTTIQFQDDQISTILESLLNSVIDNIIEEHNNKFVIPNCTFGVDKRLLSEIQLVNQHSKILGQNCTNFTIMEKIKSYVTGNSTAPLIIYGSSGGGKSVICAKIMHNVHTWIPETNLILRYVNLTELSTNLVSLLGSIAEQISVVITGKPCTSVRTIESYENYIKYTLATTKVHIILVIDSLNELIGNAIINWLPEQLSPNAKVIVTISTTNSNAVSQKSQERSPKVDQQLLTELNKLKFPNDNFIELKSFPIEQWRDVLSFEGGAFYANGADKNPIQAKILWWLAWLGVVDIVDISLPVIVDKIFEVIESKFSKDITVFLLTILVASKNGITEFDLLTLFRESQADKDIPISHIWAKFCWLMGPMILHSKTIKIMDKIIATRIMQLYEMDVRKAHKILSDYYQKQNRFFIDKKGKYKSPNTQKFLQLPYQMIKIHNYQNEYDQLPTLTYIIDLEWIRDKITAIGCVSVMNDLYQIENCLRSKGIKIDDKIHLQLLRKCIETHMHELNYDGEQFYAIINSFIQRSLKGAGGQEYEKNDTIKEWKEFLSMVKSTHLERINEIAQENAEAAAAASKEKKHPTGFDIITNLGGKGYFVASVNTEREEICVWDVSKCRRVRTLKGVPQPTTVCPVGEYEAAVLCRREIKVIDLNKGSFKVTLKGVMNQKMPYFGLHDFNHIVCLSRNRMYVNLMNLESGDCVTTFKAGEDRFLNSLLVSGDGRILVCGDETQKPFPLLVWHLSQRKLLYDLRIPHHDFITSLSAITHEGSYVCVVAKELNEPTPNFIVVYDLQSGTLFKKWKPSCNTVSLAISQTNACVVAGLEDARILIWDLVTGNCRCTLIGHNAPVTLLKLDPLGNVLLSGDREGRDMAVRLWELCSGTSLAVYTPPAKILTCEILPNGKYIVLAVENYSDLITLALKNYQQNASDESDDDNCIYGDQANDGKVFNL